jgi:hypothetical protein
MFNISKQIVLSYYNELLPILVGIIN